jgi:hypothetical protein
MNTTRLLIAIICGLSFGGVVSPLLGQTPGPSVEQQLRSRYSIASVSSNGAVLRAGSLLVVATDGIKANPPSSDIYWYNSHKPGDRIKYSVVFESFSAALADQVRILQTGEKVLLTRMAVKSSEVDFYVQTFVDNPSDVPYRACVLFQFQKGFVAPPNLKAIQDSISEVFTFDNNSPTEGSEQPQPDQPQSGQQTLLSGLYLRPETGSQLQLNTDGSFSMHTPTGEVSAAGHFTVAGDTLVLTYLSTGNSFTFRIQGGKVYTSAGAVAFVRQGDTPAPPVVPLRLPSSYVNAQTPSDQLQLNADNSFSLQEGGQTYHGTFAVTGNTLDLNISENSTKTSVTIQGNNLTDSSGQTWTLREQSAGIAPGGAMLQNEDVIKMAKAGLDDAIIIAKISSSKCQFDTSADALIRLKQSGVSAAVLRAMLGGGR